MRTVFIFIFATAMSLSAANAQQVSQTRDVDKLVEQLGSESFEKRAEAHRLLLKTRGVRAALTKAMKSSDLELARRAQLILDELDVRRNRRMLERLQQFAKEGRVDLATYLACQLPKDYEAEACWNAMTELGKVILAKNEQEGGRASCFLKKPNSVAFKFPRITLIHDRRVVDPYHYGGNEYFFARAHEVVVTNGNSGTGQVVATGPCQLDRSPGIVFTLGPIETCKDSTNAITSSILISDGDVTLHRGICDSLVIARGKVTIDGAVGESGIFGKSLHFTERAGFRNATVNRYLPLALRKFIKFFEPEQVGIEVVDDNGKVSIKSLDGKKHFARAGLQTGDIVEALDDQPVKSAESFRRLLRVNVATGVEVVVHASRAGKRLTVVVDVD